jgi:hypothetical protein
MSTSTINFENWKLGDTSEKFESARRGPGTISNGKGDNGGKSYGSFQLSLNAGTLNDFLESQTHGHYASQFKGIELGSSSFDKKWKELAVSDPQFKENQYLFIKESHYERQMQNLQQSGLELAKRGPAVQDMVWSTATQYGNLTTPIIQKTILEAGLKESQISQLSDLELITKVQQYKKDHVPEHFANSSPEIQKNLQEQRIPKETKELIKLNAAHIEHLANPSDKAKVLDPNSMLPPNQPSANQNTNTQIASNHLVSTNASLKTTPSLQNVGPKDQAHSTTKVISPGFTHQHETIFQHIANQFQETSAKFMDTIGLNAEQRQHFSKIAQQQLEQKLQSFIVQAIGQYTKALTEPKPTEKPPTSIHSNTISSPQNQSIVVGREKQNNDKHQLDLAGSLSQQQLDQIKQFFSKSPDQANKISPSIEQRR